jgi:hypothetical protein
MADTPLQIGQIIPITFCLIIVRTAMLRFKGTSHGIVTHTDTHDRLPVTRTMKVQIDRVRVVDTDVGEVSGVYPSPASSKVNSSRGSDENQVFYSAVTK